MPEANPLRPTGHVRHAVLGLLVCVTAINLGDRANLSVAGSDLARELAITPVEMGYIFSAFAWAYVLGQIPGGWMLDRFGAIRVYGTSLFIWSTFTALQGFVGSLPSYTVVAALALLRFSVGLVEAPSFPANNRLVATWFPVRERAFATSVFNSSQYLAVLVFTPMMGLITHSLGWRFVFWVMGGLGMAMALVWFRIMRDPREHSRLSPTELKYIEAGGALPPAATGPESMGGPTWDDAKILLRSRMMIGIYVSQYCVNSLQYFFITWFPIYLVRGRGMNILDVGFAVAIPGVSGFLGAMLGGFWSDQMLRRGYSLTLARKTPYVFGMLLATSLVLCNVTSSTTAVIGLMAFAIFGKGFSAMTWVVVSDTAPRELMGVAGALFNMAGNLSGIVTPVVIGYILQATGSFEGALYFVGLHSVIAAGCYAFLVGDIHRLRLDEPRVERGRLADPKTVKGRRTPA